MTQKVSISMLASTGTLPAWDGSALTGISSASELLAVKTNVALNFFLDAVNHARGVQNLSDGFVDQFEDQTGVDDPNSTNESYDTSGDFYKPLPVETAVYSRALTTTDTGWSGISIKQIIIAAGISAGGTSLKLTVHGGLSTVYGYDNIFIGTKASSGNAWDTKGDQVEVLFAGSSGVDATAGGTSQSDAVDFTWDGTEDLIISYNGTTDTSKDDIVSDTVAGYTVYQKSSSDEAGDTAPSGFSLSSNNRVIGIKAITSLSSSDITLVSDPSTALTAPSTAVVTLMKENVDAVTLNSDLIAWASRSKQTVTSNFATDNKLDATAHGLSNNDRVMGLASSIPIPMVSFDGTNDCLKITDAVLGQTDGSNYILATWISHKQDGALTSMFATVDGGSRFFVQRTAANTIFVEPRQDNGSSIGGITTTATRTISDGAYHLMIVFNMSNSTAADRIKIYFNGVRQAVTTSTAMQNDNIDFTNTGFAIGANYNAGTGSQKTTFEIGQFYLAEEFLDMDNAVNLAKIYPAKDLGANASSVTGTTPLIYLNNTTATFQNNLGSGGNFTEVGALTDGTDLAAAGSLPAGLDSETVYHVVNKTTNDFEVSLTSGGSAVALTDNGSGTHNVSAVTAVTLVDESTYDVYDIVSGTADISGQPSDTDMTLIVQTKNTKDVKIHGQSLQWS